ncbi:MAG: alkyl hydroperoxide reductase [Chloroflexota bacterium]
MGELERKYYDALAVIGVQSPKYPAEGDLVALERAVQRLAIQHPVVNDPEHRVWDAYAVTAWPTLVFLSPDGLVIGHHAGEAGFDALDHAMIQMVEEYERAGTLQRGALPYPPAQFSRPSELLSFPGKVLATPDRLFIADSGHDRLLVAGLDGEIERIIGSGEAGLQDGASNDARFHTPQGMALAGNILYVADADNHAIRAVELDSGWVSTVAGTGTQARRTVRQGPARSTELSSPWDVVAWGDEIMIAMAGLHQIWSLNPTDDTVAVWAGTGHEDIQDGPRERAWLAQPMGLSLGNDSLYIACAETQAIRGIDLHSGEVSTLAGRGLFDFGDEDGCAQSALLQHPQGLATNGDVLRIADTYNNKIKVLRVDSGTVDTLAGSGQAGTLDGPGKNARLFEPGGISAGDGMIWIADTNNHLIRTIDVASGHVRTLQLHGQGIDVRAG